MPCRRVRGRQRYNDGAYIRDYHLTLRIPHELHPNEFSQNTHKSKSQDAEDAKQPKIWQSKQL